MTQNRNWLENNRWIVGVIILIAFIFDIVFMHFLFNGKFEELIIKSENELTQKEVVNLNCTWGTSCVGHDCNCQDAPCKKYNIEELKCVREGYTGKGMFGLTDFSTEYYVCENYGKIALRCTEYYNNPQELFNEVNKS